MLAQNKGKKQESGGENIQELNKLVDDAYPKWTTAEKEHFPMTLKLFGSQNPSFKEPIKRSLKDQAAQTGKTVAIVGTGPMYEILQSLLNGAPNARLACG